MTGRCTKLFAAGRLVLGISIGMVIWCFFLEGDLVMVKPKSGDALNHHRPKFSDDQQTII